MMYRSPMASGAGRLPSMIFVRVTAIAVLSEKRGAQSTGNRHLQWVRYWPNEAGCFTFHRYHGCLSLGHKSQKEVDMHRLHLPVTCCTVCRNAGYSIALTNAQCERIINGVRCSGVNQSAIGVYDWAECPACDGSGGWDSVTKCRRCGGVGWLFVREAGFPFILGA